MTKQKGKQKGKPPYTDANLQQALAMLAPYAARLRILAQSTEGVLVDPTIGGLMADSVTSRLEGTVESLALLLKILDDTFARFEARLAAHGVRRAVVDEGGVTTAAGVLPKEVS